MLSMMLDEKRRSLTDTSRRRKRLCRKEKREEIKAGGKGEQDLFLGRPQLGYSKGGSCVLVEEVAQES